VEDDEVDLERGSKAKYGYNIYGHKCKNTCMMRKGNDYYTCWNGYKYKYCSPGPTITHKGKSCGENNPCTPTQYGVKYWYTRCDFTVNGKETYGYCSRTDNDWIKNLPKKSKGCSNRRGNCN